MDRSYKAPARHPTCSHTHLARLMCMAHIHSNMPNPLGLASCHVNQMHSAITASFVLICLGCWSSLSSFRLPLIPAQVDLHGVPCSPLNLGLQASPTPQLPVSKCLCSLAVGVELCSPFSSGSPGYGSQTGGELPFAKLDNRPGSLSEDWRCGSTCCSWHKARPALPSSEKGRPGCCRSWQVAELGVDRRAGAGAAHWLPQAHTPPASLACGSPAAPASPAASKLRSKHLLLGHVKLQPDWSGPCHGHA